MLWIIGQKTTGKKKITCFLENYVASLFTFFEKVRVIKLLQNNFLRAEKIAKFKELTFANGLSSVF